MPYNTRLLILLVALGASACAKGPEPTVRIEAIHVRLHYEQSGTLSENILDPDFVLWNVIIGEGDADEPATAATVEVLIDRIGTTADVGRLTVHLVATEIRSGRTILDATQQVVPTAGSPLNVDFRLTDVGCEPLSVTARINDLQLEKRVEVPFRCGE